MHMQKIMRRYNKKSNNKLSQKDLILYLHAAAAFQILYAGVEFKVFELLHQKKSLSINKLAKASELKFQAARSLVFGLTALGLITKNKDLYQNSKIIEDLFIKRQWVLFQKMVLMQAHIAYLPQGDFAASLKSNKNIGLQRITGHGDTLYQRLDQHPKIKKVFYDYMVTYSNFANPCLVHNVNFSKTKQIIDVGGGGAVNAIALAEHNPKLKITILDLPVASRITKQKIKENKLSDRIKFHKCDIFKEGFPKNQDAVLFIHMLVIWSLEENKILLKKAYEALNKNGMVVIFNSMAEDSEKEPLMAALDTVYFKSVSTGRGMIYPWKDYKKLLRQVGFKKIKCIRCDLWTPHGIIVAYR